MKVKVKVFKKGYNTKELAFMVLVKVCLLNVGWLNLSHSRLINRQHYLLTHLG